MLKLCLILSITICVLHSSAQQYNIEISSGAYGRKNTPVTLTLPGNLSVYKPYELVSASSDLITPVQLIATNTIVFILPDSIAPNSTAVYTLRPATRKQSDVVTIKKDPKGYLVKSNNKPVFFYNTAIVMPPPDSPGYYQRSGFIHPLYSPNGEILTDDFPLGHVHQHALFAAWTNTTFRGQFVDFWNQHLKKGTVEHLFVSNAAPGPVCGKLQVLLRYRSFEHGEVLQEVWTITVYPFRDYFLFEIDAVQTNTTTDTLYLNKYHYGGMAFRGSKYWNPDDKKNYKNNWNILTSEGIKDSAANHTHARWVDASGMLKNKIAGVTVFNHPSNFRYPQAIRVHPNFPYWAYAPVVDGPFTIDPKKKYFAQFRYYVHNGMPDLNMIERLESDYRNPPLIKVR